jgi:F-type H+-transporting ATPase subunit epsilon
MASIKIEIITPYKIAFAGEAESITLPGIEGSFQVLLNHAPLMSTLDIGVVKVQIEKNKIDYFAIAGGTVEVNNNNVLVLAGAFEAVHEIDLERAKRAAERARQRLEAKDGTTDILRAENALKRAMNRMVVVQKYLPHDTVVKS